MPAVIVAVAAVLVLWRPVILPVAFKIVMYDRYKIVLFEEFDFSAAGAVKEFEYQNDKAGGKYYIDIYVRKSLSNIDWEKKKGKVPAGYPSDLRIRFQFTAEGYKPVDVTLGEKVGIAHFTYAPDLAQDTPNEGVKRAIAAMEGGELGIFRGSIGLKVLPDPLPYHYKVPDDLPKNKPIKVRVELLEIDEYFNQFEPTHIVIERARPL
ncbi:MAG: hypothetical protein HQK86_09870 [Nitrospinae bacterium]|nr:hypothetical protein [Nitrospinota bacterium]